MPNTNRMGRSANYMDRRIMGIPMTTFIATCLSGVCYLLAIILLLACSCKFTSNTTMFFMFLLVAVLALIVMASINMVYTRYRFNCLSLSVSLLYSGSAALILFGIIYTMTQGGVCLKDELINPLEETTTPFMTTLRPPERNLEVRRDLPPPEGPDFNTEVRAPKTTASVFIWILSGFGLAFQIVGHYYYG